MPLLREPARRAEQVLRNVRLRARERGPRRATAPVPDDDDGHRPLRGSRTARAAAASPLPAATDPRAPAATCTAARAAADPAAAATARAPRSQPLHARRDARR